MGIDLGKDDFIEEYEENEREKEIRRQIQDMKEKIRYYKDVQRSKKKQVMEKN